MDLSDFSLHDFPLIHDIPTRWNDYDLLGHVNNVLYNRYVEIMVLELDRRAGLDWLQDPVIPLAVEVCVKFKRPLTPAEQVRGGLHIRKLGNSSVIYDIALFMPDQDRLSAYGHFVHVFVDRKTEQPQPIPDTVRQVFNQYLMKTE